MDAHDYYVMFECPKNETMIISSKAPCRVDMAGGTLDIWPLYLFHAGAVTVNFAVNRYASCTLQTRDDLRIRFKSRDLKISETFGSLKELMAAPLYRLPLLAHLVRSFEPATGIDITTDSEAPAGAGIAGSSTMIIAVASALNRLTNSRLPIERLREIAQNIEAQIIRVPTGAQDYYPAMYGGVLAIELSEKGVRSRKLDIPVEELNRRFVLAYTGEPRNSGINNWEVMKAHIDGNKKVHRNFDRITEIAIAMREAVERKQWPEAGRLLREEWSFRRKNAPGISTPLIDQLVEITRKNGALGAKVCGAGGGGCVFFLTEPDARDQVASVVAAEGGTVLPCEVAASGVKVKFTEK
jgi:D-glycero-alpha-D-manno-heptose-7-phosphate kinase